MSNKQINKVADKFIKAFDRLSKIEEGATPSEKRNRLRVEARASVAIEYPNLYGKC